MRKRKIVNKNMYGDKWIYVSKHIRIWKKNKKDKIKFIFWKAPGFKKIYGLKNCRMKFNLYDKTKSISIKNLRCFIRLPFFYLEKNNSSYKFGLPNLYIWKHI